MDKLLSVAENISRMSAVNALVGKIADRVAPKASAAACSGCVMYEGICNSNHQKIIVYGDIPGGYHCAGNPCTVWVSC